VSTRDSLLHRLARGIPVSWFAAKPAGAIVQKRPRLLVDGVGTIRLLAHHQHALPALEVRNPRIHRRDGLWLDLAPDRFDIRFRGRSCARGCHLALSLS